MTGHLPGKWKLADHPEHGRVMVVRTFGDKAIYATPAEMLGIHTRVSLLSDLTFVGTDNQNTEEALASSPTGRGTDGSPGTRSAPGGTGGGGSPPSTDADALAASAEELERSRPPVHVPPGVSVPVGRRRRRYGCG